jgi:hypothetical protein
MSFTRAVPVFHGAHSIRAICKDLRQHGLVVIETMRTAAPKIAAEVEAMMGLEPEAEDDAKPFVLHLSAPIEPLMEFGWIDYLVYSESFDGCPLRAKSMVAAAARSWKSAGEPDYHVARIRD